MDNEKQICASCQGANTDDAQFCEHCGKPLPSRATAPARRGINWGAILAIAVLVVVVTWLNNLLVQGGKATGQKDQPDKMGAAHSIAGDETGSVQDVQQIVNDSTTALEADPLDMGALSELYSIYGSIGELDKVQPYAKAAVAAWRELPEDQRDAKHMADVAMLSSKQSDLESALLAFEAYREAEPQNFSLLATLGNLCFQLSRRELPGSDAARQQAQAAIGWYDAFLEQATPESHPQQYWNVAVDRTSMLLALLDQDSPDYTEVLTELGRVTDQAPGFWMGWHHLGLVQKLADDDQAAIASFSRAKEIGKPREAWESEQQLAVLEDREADPGDFDPSDPHSGLNMGGSELPPALEDMPNPHGEGDGQAPANPHGMPRADGHDA